MKTIPLEKRLFPRIYTKLPFRYHVIGQRHVSAARTKDISASGLGFVAEKFIAPATNIRLEIGIPLKTVNPVGRVVWSQAMAHSDNYRIGLEFTKINYKERCELADFIDERLFQMIKKG
ncbi:MAG: PilZ domain-containing protein [Candidatus Omnitrophica bacterium]|nr:PilZ domain-containing protein [Candidatus Omnitrophota bacterium]MDD5610385.1 PilZ domain-containing protein [Candidatus Omnitrophota bacterium]